MKLGINPVEAHRKEQKKKELAKIQKQRQAKKQQDLDKVKELDDARLELNELESLNRPLNPKEKALRKKLKLLLDPQPVQSDALFDPLQDRHGLKSGVLVTGSSTTVQPMADLTKWSDSESELAQDPPFPPMDTVPSHYKVPPGPVRYKFSSGYPPLPTDPIPKHNPQQVPPLTSTTKPPVVPPIKRPSSSSMVISAEPVLLPSRRQQVLSMVPDSVKNRFLGQQQKSATRVSTNNEVEEPSADEHVLNEFINEINALI